MPIGSTIKSTNTRIYLVIKSITVCWYIYLNLACLDLVLYLSIEVFFFPKEKPSEYEQQMCINIHKKLDSNYLKKTFIATLSFDTCL